MSTSLIIWQQKTIIQFEKRAIISPTLVQNRDYTDTDARIYYIGEENNTQEKRL